MVELRDLGQLVEEVHHLLGPAHKVAGGEVGSAEHVLKMASLGPFVHGPHQAEFRFAGQWQPVAFLGILQLGPFADDDVYG